MVQMPALPSAAWIRSVDATYSLFESRECREKYGALSQQVQKAVQLCEEVIQEFGIDQCALSFNGGKDCNVLIHILAAVLRRLGQTPQSTSSSTKIEDILPPIPSLYISCSSPFQEVEDFVSDSICRYNMKIVRLEGDMKQGLERYLDGHGKEMKAVENGTTLKRKRNVKAIFIGTRRTDPHCANLKTRNPTDEGWPDVERVQPILDWSYQDVWLFLRCPIFAIPEEIISKSHEGVRWGEPYGIPYCVLYDQGYTSLGSTFNTFPNPMLDTRKGDDNSPPSQHYSKMKDHFQPAYMLKDESLERAGRMSQQKSTKGSTE